MGAQGAAARPQRRVRSHRPPLLVIAIRGGNTPLATIICEKKGIRQDIAFQLESIGAGLHGDARHRPTVVPHAPAACMLHEHEGPAAGFDE